MNTPKPSSEELELIENESKKYGSWADSDGVSQVFVEEKGSFKKGALFGLSLSRKGWRKEYKQEVEKYQAVIEEKDAEIAGLKEELQANDAARRTYRSNAIKTHTEQIEKIEQHESLRKIQLDLIKTRDAEIYKQITRNNTLEEKLRVAREALKKARQFCTWLSVDSLKYPGTDAGMAGKHEGQDIDKALAKLAQADGGEGEK